MSGSLWALMGSTTLIAVLHALAPDHWIPMVNLSIAQRWTSRRLTWMTFLAGIGHVGSSVLIGGVGVLMGVTLNQLKGFETQRGLIAGLLLMGFGLGYVLWGWRQYAQQQGQEGGHSHRAGLALLAALVIGPCEPLLPLMFLAYAFGWLAVTAVAALFSATTITMMLAQVLLARKGLCRGRWIRNFLSSHIATGLSIVVTGFAVLVLGL